MTIETVHSYAHQKVKRRPLLADRFLSSPVLFDGKDGKRFRAVKEHLREAKKFVLDEAAAGYLAEFIKNHPEAIARDQEFAIPCFPRMYVEFPHFKFYESMNGPYGDREMGDTEVGYLYDGPTVYVLCQNRDSRRPDMAMSPNIMPISYRLNRPFDLKEEVAMAERMRTSRIGIDAMYWGGSVMNTNLSKESQRSLRTHHSFELWYGQEVLTPETISVLSATAAGDLRNILAMALFLNRTRDVTIEDVIPAKQGFIGNHLHPMQRHSVVRLKLDPKPLFKKIYGHPGTQHREHDCRGHFCHNKEARKFGHHKVLTPEGMHAPEWQEYKVNQWRCMVCGGLKWWRRDHKRGHKEKGTVVTQYEVTK